MLLLKEEVLLLLGGRASTEFAGTLCGPVFVSWAMIWLRADLKKKEGLFLRMIRVWAAFDTLDKIPWDAYDISARSTET